MGTGMAMRGEIHCRRFGMTWNPLRSKTFWTAIGAIAVAMGAYVSGQIGKVELIAAIFAALQTIFIRHGVEKSKGITVVSEREK